jgi:DNA processing protein
VEAAEKSGSLITARFALDQGRDVLAVPGNILSGRNTGAHALLRDGARIVESAGDILDEIGVAPITKGADADGCGESISLNLASQDPVLHHMASGESYDLDELAGLSGMNRIRLLQRLLELELSGAVERVDGGRFVRSSTSLGIP